MTSSAQTPEPTDEQRAALSRSSCPQWHRDADGWCVDETPHLAHNPAEPSAEQRLWALTFVTRVLESETPEQIDETERDLAPALAAAVIAEREKYLRVADELESTQSRYVSDLPYAARRIREVSR